MDGLGAALACHALGLSVFPLWPKSKNPAIEEWKPYQYERAPIEKIRDWWQHRPTCNIAVACGPVSGVLVVDVDGDKGAETLANLQRQHGALPATWRSRTGKGEHIWFKYPEGLDVTNARGQLEKTGIDIRGDGGYVAAPGSIHQNGAVYQWQDDAAPDQVGLAECPQWFLELLKKRPPAPRRFDVGEINGHADRYAEAAFVAEINEVRGALEGERNNTLHRSAIKLSTLVAAGALEEVQTRNALFSAALECGLDEREAQATIESGFKFGLQHPREIPERERIVNKFTEQASRPVIQEAPTIPPPPGELPLYPLTIPEKIPPRPWLFGYWLMRGAVTLLAAPGGTGKTSLVTSIILSCATGRALLGIEPHRRLTVAFLGLEESRDEMARRFKAAMIHHGIEEEEFEGRVYYLDGRTYGFSAASMGKDGNVTVDPDMQMLTAQLQTLGVDILAADPLALAHSAPENDNTAMARVISYFAALAASCEAGVMLIHHTRKGAVAGDPDAIRGAGALINHARIAIGLSPPNDEDKEQLCIKPEDAKRFVRVDDLKMNYAVKSAEARWLELTSVSLGNSNEEYPYGDSVQVPVKWTPQNKAGSFTARIANDCLDVIDAGIQAPKGTERYSAAPRSGPRGAHRVIIDVMRQNGNEMTDKDARRIINGWLAATPPVLREKAYWSDNESKERIGLYVNHAARPS